METLGSLSRLYALALIADRGPLTADQLHNAISYLDGVPRHSDFGRGASVDDYVRVMVREGVLVERGGALDLTPLGHKLVLDLSGDTVATAVRATPPFAASRPGRPVDAQPSVGHHGRHDQHED